MVPVEPSISAFVASPTTTLSGGLVDFSWTMQNAGGYSFLITCQAGIKLKYINGSVFPCDTKVSTTLVVNDLIRVIISNVSGGTKTITARLIPKNASGDDRDALARDISINVSTAPQTLTSFWASATTTLPVVPVTINWTSQEIEGVNLQIECQSDIKVNSPSYTAAYNIPCNTPIFTTPLGPSSSLSLNFTNSSKVPLSYKLTLLPAITLTPTPTYDALHALDLTLTIASDVIPDPSIDYFLASTTVVESYKPLNISWSTVNAKGANLKISCVNNITATSSQTSALFLLCGDFYVFTNDLNSSGTLKLFFRNQNKTSQNVILTLIPAKKPGEYYSILAKSVALTVLPEGTVISTALSVPPPAPTPTVGVSTPAPLSSGAAAKVIFTQVLRRGSRGPRVSALQEFLKKDPVLYPEGLVTGFFGPATERAVQRFQKKYGIVSSGTPVTTGYGTVGPKTRAKLNELQ